MTKILIAGDFVPVGDVKHLIDEGGYEVVCGEIPPITAKDDYSIVNLEAPVVNGNPTPIVKSGPNLFCTAKTLDAIKYAGFNCVTLANNHFYDQGEKGAITTFEECDKRALDYVGAGHNIREASRVFYKEINGICFAFINCCEHEYSIATDTTSGSNPIDPIQQYYQIKEAKKIARHIIVICHGGIESLQYPTPRMVKWYRFFVDAGADVVVNHHQHCFSGYEVYKGKPVFYGLGNFCFYRKRERNTTWNEGFMVELAFDDNNITFELHPYIQCNVKPAIEVLKSQDKNDALNKIEAISDAICSGQYEKYFNEYITSNSNYDWVFTPYTNRILRKLYSKKLLPTLLTRKNWQELRDLQLCESHNERYRHFILSKLKK